MIIRRDVWFSDNDSIAAEALGGGLGAAGTALGGGLGLRQLYKKSLEFDKAIQKAVGEAGLYADYDDIVKRVGEKFKGKRRAARIFDWLSRNPKYTAAIGLTGVGAGAAGGVAAGHYLSRKFKKNKDRS